MKILSTPLMNYVLGGLLFSLAGVVFKPLVGIFEPLEIVGWRSLIVVLTILGIRFFNGRSLRSLPLSFSKWQWFSAAALTIQTIFFSIAILISSTADTFLVCNATPIYMVFWQALFDRRLPTRIEIATIGLASVGLVIFFADALSQTSITGFGSSLIAGVAFAGHIYSQGRVGREGDKEGELFTMGSVILGNSISCILALLWTCTFSTAHIDTAPGWSAWLLLSLGIFQFALPMMLWARSLPSISPLIAAFMPTLIAVWAPCWTYLVLAESFPGATTIIGAVIVHAAVLVAALRRAGAKRGREVTGNAPFSE